MRFQRGSLFLLSIFSVLFAGLIAPIPVAGANPNVEDPNFDEAWDDVAAAFTEIVDALLNDLFIDGIVKGLFLALIDDVLGNAHLGGRVTVAFAVFFIGTGYALYYLIYHRFPPWGWGVFD